MDPELAQAIAMINAQVAQGYLSLNRDIYSNISLPNYRDVTFPGASGNLTGFIPQDYRKPYSGLPTFGALEGTAGMMGRLGNDPRWAEMGYNPGDLTIGGELNLAQLRSIDAAREQMVRGAEQRQNESDRRYAMDINADPNSVIAGQILPDWLKPHAEWARQFVQQNNGRLPRYDELKKTLAGAGRSPEDYLPGGAFYGANSNATVQPLGQGAPIAGAPQTTPFGAPAGTPPPLPTPAAPRGDITSGWGKVINDQHRAVFGTDASPAIIDQVARQMLQTNMSTDQVRAAVQRAAAAASPTVQGGPAAVGPAVQRSASVASTAGLPGAPGGEGDEASSGNTKQGMAYAQVITPRGGGPTFTGDRMAPGGAPAAMMPLPRVGSSVLPPGAQEQTAAGPEQNTGAFASQGGDARLGIEPWQRGGADMVGRLAGQGGDLNYAGSGVTGGIGYGQAMSPFQRQLIEMGRQHDVTAQLTRRGQDITERGQQGDIALRALQQESQLRADPFQLARYRYGLGQTGIPGVIGAVAGRGVLPGVQGGQGPAPQQPTLGNQIGQVNQPTFGLASADQQAAALGPLSQVNARNYLRAGPGGQQYVNSAYRYAGQAGSDEDIQDAVRRGLPQFARRGVPTFGRVA